MSQEVLQLFLVRDELLQKYDSWSEKIKIDLQHQDAKFDIIPLLCQKYEILNEINFVIGEFSHQEHAQAGAELFDLLEEVNGMQGLPCLAKYDLVEKGRLNFSFAWFPFEAIRKITGASIVIRQDAGPDLIRSEDQSRNCFTENTPHY